MIFFLQFSPPSLPFWLSFTSHASSDGLLGLHARKWWFFVIDESRTLDPKVTLFNTTPSSGMFQVVTNFLWLGYCLVDHEDNLANFPCLHTSDWALLEYIHCFSQTVIQCEEPKLSVSLHGFCWPHSYFFWKTVFLGSLGAFLISKFHFWNFSKISTLSALVAILWKTSEIARAALHKIQNWKYWFWELYCVSKKGVWRGLWHRKWVKALFIPYTKYGKKSCIFRGQMLYC